MNNPLEAVTQAVNSLVTALKLPDESAKANEVLGEMSFPQFSRLLPYRDYNQESGLFMNDTTMGFMLEAIPINGANESIVEALDHMLRTKLPRGVPFCIHLMSSQLVGDRIEYGLREFSWSGEQAERFNAITRAYYMNAAATQFPLPEGMNLPLTLRHYRVFFSYCSPSKKKSRADILEMENLVKIIRASLQGASITTQAVDAQAFIDIVGEMINHNPDSLYPKRRQLDPYSDLNYQCVEDSFDLKVRADYLTLGLREKGRNSTARILNFHLARNPEIAFLWNMADNYSNLLNPELSISCPFILTLTLVVEDQVKTHSEANLKYMDLEKKSKTSYAKWFPSVEKEAKEWGELRQRLGSGQSSVVSYFLNITAFCKDNNETALEVEQDILNSFRKNGFELISPRFNHMRNFLTCLPFMAGKGLFKQLKEAGVVQRAESFNVANLMPLVADNPLTPAGLLAPTYRNQLAFIDIFFRGMNNTNYNMAVCGTSGAGKTGLIQPLIRSVLDSGGFAVVFDMGDGYKSLCENMGGVYLDGETLRFNPFANITDIDQSAERVRDQLSVMASPNGNLDEVHEGLLLQAVRASWLAKKNRARIDDVVDFLKNARDNDQYVESPTIRSRLDEMIVLLDQYTAGGTYGRYFNSDEPSLRDDAKMVVLELGGLEDRPSLLVAVMFSLIIYIENRMYRTPRNLKKLNVIDEGWRLLDFKNHKVGEFIEKGYRTARRHTGAYITITQNIVDFDSDKASSAARAAWGNSSYKIILKQSAKEFAKYNQLYCLFIFFWILVGLVLWVKISWQTFVNGCIYWWCTTLEGMRDLIRSQPVYEIQYYGKTFRMNAAQVLHDKYMIWCGEQLWSAFVLATVVALVICLITFFVVSWILGRQGKQQSENEVTGGRQLTDNPKDVARMLKKDGKDSDIRIGDLPIIRDSEIQNFCLHGTVGAGKSEVIRRLANYARQRGDMVVIYDRSGEFVKSYYDPSIDKILNPLDARCAAWDLWKECLTQPDFDNTANTLIPMGTKEDPFWQGSGRTIFAEAAYLMRNDPNRSYSKLVDTLLSIKIEKLRTFLRNSPAANLVEEKIEKTAISIRAVLTNYVKAIRYLQGIEHNGESFTIRDWMRGVREDQKNGWLFISSNADTHASLKPV
ncbi:type IV secretion system protein TraC, partial [Escherichia coli]